MRDLLRRHIERRLYMLLLRNLHPVYAALEGALDRFANDPLVASMRRDGLRRLPALGRDLETLHGGGWEVELAVTPPAAAYAHHIVAAAERAPLLLLAHGYVRYLGDLSGGQALGRLVAEALALPAGGGTEFYR